MAHIYMLLCSHRLAAFPLADCIIVLDGGRILERGTHGAELMVAGGLYVGFLLGLVALVLYLFSNADSMTDAGPMINEIIKEGRSGLHVR